MVYRIPTEQIEKSVNGRMIRKALNHVGYNDALPTEKELISCFADYVFAGTFSNIEFALYEDINELIADQELTLYDIYRNLIRL